MIGFFTLGFFLGKTNFSQKKSVFKEPIPFGYVLEIMDFKVVKLYNSENELSGAEIDIKVNYTLPYDGLPEEYNPRELRLRVKGIPSLDELEILKSALESNKYLKLNEGRESGIVVYDSEKIKLKNNRSAVIIKTIKVKPEGYTFVKY